MVGQAAIQVVPVELAGLRDHSDLEDGDPSFALECPPGVDVGVVVQLGDDDRISRPQPPPDGPRQVKRQRGHVEPKANLGGGGIEKIGHGLPRIDERRVGLGTGRKTPVRVGIVVNQIIGHGLDHGGGDLCPSGSVEIGDAMTMIHLARARGRPRGSRPSRQRRARAAGRRNVSCRHLQ